MMNAEHAKEIIDQIVENERILYEEFFIDVIKIWLKEIEQRRNKNEMNCFFI